MSTRQTFVAIMIGLIILVLWQQHRIAVLEHENSLYRAVILDAITTFEKLQDPEKTKL